MADWRTRAACLGMDTNLFFPDKGQHIQSANMRTLCDSRCPVRENCLRAAMEQGNQEYVYGIWGGKNQKQRLQLVLAPDGKVVPRVPDEVRLCAGCGSPLPEDAVAARQYCLVCRPTGAKNARPGLKAIKHGTPAGYRQHRYRGIEPCAECREANARRDRERRAEMRRELKKLRKERSTPAWPPPVERPRVDLIRELATPAERPA